MKASLTGQEIRDMFDNFMADKTQNGKNKKAVLHLKSSDAHRNGKNKLTDANNGGILKSERNTKEKKNKGVSFAVRLSENEEEEQQADT